jgi:hypothetical protein
MDSSQGDALVADNWCKRIDQDDGGVMDLDELRSRIAGVLEIPDGVGQCLEESWSRV